MKRVRGRSLTEILGTETAPLLEQKLGIFQKVCDAVTYAHAHRILHRDLKPHNVMVDAFGEVLVMDWGLARPWGTARGAAAGERPSWSDLLERVFRLDGHACPGCGGPLTLRCVVVNPPATRRILDGLRRATGPPGLDALGDDRKA